MSNILRLLFTFNLSKGNKPYKMEMLYCWFCTLNRCNINDHNGPKGIKGHGDMRNQFSHHGWDINYKTITGKFQLMWESPPATADRVTSRGWGGRSILRALWVQRTPVRSLWAPVHSQHTQTRVYMTKVTLNYLWHIMREWWGTAEGWRRGCWDGKRNTKTMWLTDNRKGSGRPGDQWTHNTQWKGIKSCE